MKIYAYKGNAELGKEALGTFDKLLFDDLKTNWGIIRRCKQVFKTDDFMVYSYSNFYDNNTFRQIFHE